MNNPLPSVTYVTIKQLLLNRLQTALSLYLADTSVLSQPNQHIYLHRAKDNSRVLYSCAIALQLSRADIIPALDIANAIATLIRQAITNTDDSVNCDFAVSVVPPGWIHLELTEPAIAAWLQRLVQGDKEFLSSKDRPLPTTSSLFAVQYAHARCCSLVQMAHREGLITLKEPIVSSSSSALFHIDAPNPIPWLNSDQIRLCHSAERALIAQLLELLDDLYCPCPSRQRLNWEKAALSLSQAFQTFYSCCRIWGEVKIQTIYLAQARLGLVIATQSVLRLLLQWLGVSAPLEL